MVAGDDPPPVGSPDRGVDPWARFRRRTPARVGLGRIGDTMPLRPVLDFQLAHAEARDAVHASLDVAAIASAMAPHRTLTLCSAAADRLTYLRRPDLGRALDAGSRAMLEAETRPPADCVFVIADGLSATAVQRHAVPLLEHALPGLESLALAPIVIATQARVALGDAVGACLNARLCVVLIGERPGLSVADSLGVYMTYDPRPGRRDCERNCISNIHANGGLGYRQAADKMVWLVKAALARQVTGVALKDEGGTPTLTAP